MFCAPVFFLVELELLWTRSFCGGYERKEWHFEKKFFRDLITLSSRSKNGNKTSLTSVARVQKELDKRTSFLKLSQNPVSFPMVFAEIFFQKCLLSENFLCNSEQIFRKVFWGFGKKRICFFLLNCELKINSSQTTARKRKDSYRDKCLNRSKPENILFSNKKSKRKCFVWKWKA